MVKFYFKDTVFSILSRKVLKQFIAGIFSTEGVQFHAVSIIICSDNFLLSINQQFLQHDDYTDIITFTLSESGKPVTGEIYISADRIRENASTFKVNLKYELHRVMFHGVLHLCGYTDKNEKDKMQMTRMEDKYLTKYFQIVPRIPVSR